MHRKLLSASLLLLLAGAPSIAEVYQNLPANAGISSRQAATAYSGSMSINGGRATVSVLSYDAPLANVLKGLESDYANRQGALFMAGRMTGLAVVQKNNRIYRFLAITPTHPDHTLLFKIEQSLGDYERSKRPPTRSLLTELPTPPGATPDFHMKDNKTAMAIEMSTSAMYPADIHRHISQSMSTHGWTPLTPLERMQSTPGLMIYLRGKELAMVSASINPHTRQSTITMLHKRPALR